MQTFIHMNIPQHTNFQTYEHSAKCCVPKFESAEDRQLLGDLSGKCEGGESRLTPSAGDPQLPPQHLE